MSLHRATVIAMVVLLVGRSFTPDPEPTRTPSATTSDSATPEPGVTSSPTVAPPVPMSVIQDLTKDGAKQTMRRITEVTNNRPALKLDASASEVTLTVLKTSQKPLTLRWRVNQIVPTESDIQYLGQTTFHPIDCPLGSISELFDTATQMEATGTEKILQAVKQHSGEVYLTVTVTPETKTVFFEKNNTAMRNLGYMSVAGPTDGLAAVIAGSRAATRVGFGSNTGYWINLSANNGIIERRTRSAALLVYMVRLKETFSFTPFDPIRLNALVLARSIQRFGHGFKAGCRIEVDNRYRCKIPITRYNCSGRVYFTDPDGAEYPEDQPKQ